MVNKWSVFKQSIMRPRHCFLCHGAIPSHIHGLCEACYADLPLIQHACRRCAIPLAASEAEICAQCLQDPPWFDRSIIPFLYATPLQQMTTQLKFQQRMHFLPTLAQLAIEKILLRSAALPELLLPVPLHPRRLKQRGFNQAAELASYFSRHSGVACKDNLCTRQFDTQHQTGLDARARQKNIRNAFQVKPLHQYHHVAIVDDVVTTGSTVNELAKTLKKAGVEKIEVWAIARTAR